MLLSALKVDREARQVRDADSAKSCLTATGIESVIGKVVFDIFSNSPALGSFM